MAFRDLFKGLKLGRRRAEPQRDTRAFPNLVQLSGQRPDAKVVFKPTPRNLRYFSRTPYARRAINAVKNPISMLEWDIVPVDGVEINSELKRQIAAAKASLSQPNRDDGFRAMIEQVVEDLMVGAGAIEKQRSGDEGRPLWLWPVDGLSIQIFPGWAGDASEARYAQAIGYGSYAGGGITIQLRDDELIYIRPNPTTASPFGLGPLEVAFNSISRQLGVGEYAGNITTNARPNSMIDLGETADDKTVAAFRAFWTNEVEGQGIMPIIGTKGGKVLKLHPDGDEALFLEWQRFLVREIATACDLSPQNFGLEADVNRNTSEVAHDRDWDQAIRPMAHLVQSALTRGAVQQGMGFSQLRFKFLGLDREDEAAIAEIFAVEYENNATTPDEYRASRGRDPIDSEWGSMTKADVEIAMRAAAGTKTLIDPDLPNPGAPARAPRKRQA